jgi:hypothetical protein
MQRQVLKIVIIVLPLFLMPPALSAQVSAFRLQQADSLYEKKQYTQSLDHYRSILDQKEYTPAMILKMAYIEEGLNRVGQALYYLNLYYLASNDKFVLEKMEELAAKFNLDGYKNSDADLALSFYHDYQLPVSLTLAALSVFFLSLLFYWRKKGKRSMVTGVLLFTMLALLGAHLNFGEKVSTAIVGEPNTYLMDGPSAGASVVSVIDEGHRVEVVGKTDVWYEVKWNENTVFVRDHDLLVVEL